ncbi:Nin one binding Zn-ribbon like-domain-containing protein [Hysterangium stoloniferum]|nr:Nin one binding Zn-ribbon like-domain-containing protein [Hysterangium stoloniferum]
MQAQITATKVKTLVLDAGPLLSLTPLKGLAERYVTVPQVLEELRDKKAREHLDNLTLTAGVNIEVRSPDIAAISKVTLFAKKTGDYAVLSATDLCVLALTYTFDEEAKASQHKESKSESISTANKDVEAIETTTDMLEASLLASDRTAVSESTAEVDLPEPAELSSSESEDSAHVFDDPSDEDDGEGEWITPNNVALHKSRALELLPEGEASQPTRHGQKPPKKKPNEDTQVAAGCITADFAMQNVLLQMGLNLIGVEGKRIRRLKTWVLRCHACYKICKDPSKKFCPSCGNPTLLRTSVTVTAGTPGEEPTLQVHLKKNFQYRNRGTKYSIPAPKPGSSKSGPGSGLILREDQIEWVRAERRAEGRRQKEEKKMVNAISTSTGTGVKLPWMDPDWMPEMFTVGAGGKGRTSGKGDMPTIGHGRKNPNERRRQKK